MNTRIFYGLLMLCLFKVAYTQNTFETNTYYFYSHNVSPAAPSVNDSVFVYFVIEFPQHSARKISGNCNIGDTIVYHGCYFNPGFSPSYSYVYDTLSLGKLSVGEHDVFIVARYALNSTDSACLTTNDTWNDTLHLVIDVTQQTGIAIENTTPSYVSYNSNYLRGYSVGANSSLQILNLQGERVSSIIRLEQSTFMVDISHLPAGLYLSCLQSDTEKIVTKFLKH